MPKLSDKALQNVHKVVYLAKQYPDRTIRELSGQLTISVFEANAAIWRARELGYLYVDGKTGFYKVEKEPAAWEFGSEVNELMDTIIYVFKKLAEDENDLEDTDLGRWLVGHLPHNQAIAVKKLIEDEVLATYELTDVEQPSKKGLKRGKKPRESTYTFYCLKENLGKEWGRKQFKDASKLK